MISTNEEIYLLMLFVISTSIWLLWSIKRCLYAIAKFEHYGNWRKIKRYDEFMMIICNILEHHMDKSSNNRTTANRCGSACSILCKDKFTHANHIVRKIIRLNYISVEMMLCRNTAHTSKNVLKLSRWFRHRTHAPSLWNAVKFIKRCTFIWIKNRTNQII